MIFTLLSLALKCKYTLPNLFLVSIIFTFSYNANAQSPNSAFNIATPLTCENTDASFTNTSINSIVYAWDFCEGDLDSIPLGIDLNSISGGAGPEDIELAKDGANWYGFIASFSNNKLIKAAFGNDLESIPTYTNLGDFGGLLIQPSGVIVLKEGLNWYGFVISGANSPDLIRLSFGTSLNNIPSAQNLGTLGGSISNNYGLEFARDNNKNILFISNRSSRRITRVNFGASIINIPSSSDISNIQLPAGGFYRNVAITKSNGNWFGVAVSENGNIQKLSFGNSPLNNPQIAIITPNLPAIFFPTDVKFLKDKGNNYAFILGRDGKLHRLNFKDDLTNDFPDYLNMGNIGGFTTTQGFSWVKENSQWYVGSISVSLNKLYQMKFPNNCSSSIPESSQFEPTGVNYSTSGYKHISLTAFNSFGESDYAYDSILINRGPTARFSSNFKCAGTNTQFSDASYFDKPITGYLWDFGDPASGSNNSSTAQSPWHNYALSGNYDVTLQTTDECGVVDIIIQTIKIYNANDITADFLAAPPTCQYGNISFIDQSTFVEDEVITWFWDFNGESTSTQQNPLFAFTSPGTKNVTLTSTGLSGCSYYVTKPITVEEAPTTAFSFTNVCAGQTTSFTDLTTGNNLLAWNWDFGDGNNSAIPNPTHTYSFPGKYAVTLTVSNNLGCSTSITDTVYNNALPVVSFTYDLPCSTSPIQFSDQSIVQDAGLVAWAWDFGDGNSSTARNPQHTYKQTGNFSVQLKVYSQFGCVDSLAKAITVIQGPEVNFSWDKACTGESTTFTDETNSSGQAITNWAWLIDNTVFDQQNPKYTFSSAGVSTVMLSVTTSNLCAQTIAKDIIIEEIPASSFAYFESCTDNNVTFYDTTPATLNTREWRIDGTPAGTDSVMISSLNPGNYVISLATTTAGGCTGTLIKDISIVGPPVASFSANTFYGAPPLQIQFTNQSTGADTYLWQFGDANNSTSSEINPAFVFTLTGTYTVTLMASGGQNCRDTTFQTIHVVDPEHGLSIDAITRLDDGKIGITLSNLGSITYNENNSRLIFTLDNGVELTEAFSTELYPERTINYAPALTLGEIGNAKTLCAKLQYFANQATEILDENCLSLSNKAVIINAYPNPVTDYINLSVVLVDAGMVNIKLIDSKGATLFVNSDDSAQPGLNSYTINTTPYRSGLYIVKVETEKEAKEMKVVIDK